MRPDNRPRNPGSRSLPPSDRSSGQRVLVVEDDLAQRIALAALLKRWGHEVQTAPDGPTGVARALSWLPDVAIVDLGLPGFGGLEVARRLRGALFSHPLRMVAMTGFDGDQFRTRALAAGFDSFLPKPLQPTELVELLESKNGASTASSRRPASAKAQSAPLRPSARRAGSA
jgi:CheY-like chemotaxis protein